MTLLAEGFVGRFEVCTVVVDNMCFLDDKLLSNSLSPEEYCASIEGFNCEDRDDSNFFLEDKLLIVFMIAVSGGLSREDDESRCCLDKEFACDWNKFVTT